MSTKEINITLSTFPEDISELELFVDKLSDTFNLGHTYFSNIIVSLSEILKAARLHNPQQKANVVNILLKEEEGKLVFVLYNAFFGFKDLMNQYISGTDAIQGNENLYTIISLCDGIEFLESGKIVEIRFDISGANEFLSRNRIGTLHNANKKIQKKSMHE